MWNDSEPDINNHLHRREAALLLLAFVFLCLIAGGLTLSDAARSQDWTDFPGRLQHLILIPVWGIGAWLLHREIHRAVPRRDPYLLPIAMLLTGWGVLLIWRLNPAFGLRQTLWLSIACLLVLGLCRLDPGLSWLRDFRYLWMIAALALLGMTLIFGTNPLGGEPRLWLGCCGVYLQPSEPLRFFLVAFLAAFLADRLRQGGSSGSDLNWRELSPLLFIWGISILLLIVQRDLGTGMIFLALLASLLFMATGSWQILLVSAVFGFAGATMSYFLFDVVQVRVQAWLNPWLDPTGASYQIVQSLISIASGGVFGRGPGLGSPGFVPASHTDFIFSAIVEEFGLIGAIGTLSLYAAFVSRGLRIVTRRADVFARFLAAGLTLALGIQTIFIIGGVMRALPLVGITLPFVSYGGSSLLTSFAALAILLLTSQSEEGEISPKLRALTPIHAGFSIAWCGLALVAAWWTINRAPTLTARTDNPRRALDGRFIERGAITDRNGELLAFSQGSPGEYERIYPHPVCAPVTGFDSTRYGQAGIESSMDSVLRGLERGSDFQNAWLRLISSHPPQGEDIQLTLDLDLQTVAMEALSGQVGAAVLLEARTGELYVIASQPGYDPGLLDQTWQDLVEDPDAPLFNRATQGLYQPGLAMAPFLLAQTRVEYEEMLAEPVQDLRGRVAVDGEWLTCSQAPPVAAKPTLASAFQYLCPVPIQQAMLDLGWEPVLSAIETYGLVEPAALQLDLADTGGLQFERTDAALADLAIGQGALGVSPVQMARAFGGLFAGEQVSPLILVRAVNEEDEGWIGRTPEGFRVPPPSEATTRVLRELYSGTTAGLVDVSAEALSGGEAQRLGWYLGALDQEGHLWVVVVVLEDSQAQHAAAIGAEIFRALNSP